ncbi:hypothetical protein ABK661_03560 [Klebsiella pneumoniae]|uniref:hypothetical protein n=1 Tax=Klebsiella pneumoniae TaxID=573 RepID=UPI001299C3BF|nr:hypothetical protein [Klebsiella pneumoniae]MBC4905448.1 hypothetical protein [Klebsiella pneumoniae]MBC5242533.1 hypothetical protein [Klebsiella pneumoniae]MRE34048.1 hypothetical protein [Klebsiella pneumoniae]MRF23528.1 hypothetical protein [Klebsiella pneumoniae]
MNIETVNELIRSLESAGELSIREQKFLKLAKAYQQLAAENLALKNPDNWLSLSEYGDKAAEVASGNGASEDEALRIGLIAIINRIATPATDRIVAGIKADGVEEWVSSRGGRWNGTTEEALKFAKQLREGADKC